MRQQVLNRLANLVTDLGKQLLKRRIKHEGGGGPAFGAAADRYAHETLCGGLQQILPDIPLVSEEDTKSHTQQRPDCYWLIDPIDGTASYCGGFPGYVTQLALMENDEPVLCAVYAPVSRDLFLAERSAGATLNGKRLHLDGSSAHRRLIDNYPEPRATAAQMMHALSCSGYIESGSLGLKICRIADGSAEIFFKNVVIRDWDIAPAALVLHEAGGTLTGTDGKPFLYVGDFVKPGVVATATRGLARETVAALRKFTT